MCRDQAQDIWSQVQDRGGEAGPEYDLAAMTRNMLANLVGRARLVGAA
jgi:hypothetical protein